MRILIIRHGEPDYTIDSLTEKGWREAEILSHRLTKLDIKDFYCSPLGRAKDTAKPTLEKFNKSATILPWLKEFRGKIEPFTYGKKEFSIPWDLPYQVWQDDKKFYNKDEWFDSERIKKGDSKEIFEEVKNGVDELLKSYGYIHKGMAFECEDNTDFTIAIFCHFALGSAIIGYLTGIAPNLLWQGFFMPPTAVSTLVSSEIKKGEVTFRCMQYGDTSHLYFENEPLSASGLMPEVYDKTSYRNIE